VKYLVALLSLCISGCASLYYAGESDYRITLQDGTEIVIHSGKQQQSVKATFNQTSTGYEITLEETGVQAFAGQQAVVDATSNSVGAATTAVIDGLKLMR
jgi:uncharacterized protein YbcV (DUF1398 family)